MMTEMMTMNKTRQVFGVGCKFLRTENTTLRYRAVDSMWSRPTRSELEGLRPVGEVRVEPGHHRTLNSKPSTKNLPQCVMIYSVEGGAEVEQHQSTDVKQICDSKVTKHRYVTPAPSNVDISARCYYKTSNPTALFSAYCRV